MSVLVCVFVFLHLCWLVKMSALSQLYVAVAILQIYQVTMIVLEQMKMYWKLLDHLVH